MKRRRSLPTTPKHLESPVFISPSRQKRRKLDFNSENGAINGENENAMQRDAKLETDHVSIPANVKVVHIGRDYQMASLREYFKKHHSNQHKVLRSVSEQATLRERRMASQNVTILILHDTIHDEPKTLTIAVDNITITSIDAYSREQQSSSAVRKANDDVKSYDAQTGIYMAPVTFASPQRPDVQPPPLDAPFHAESSLQSTASAFDSHATLRAPKIIIKGKNVTLRHLNVICSSLKLKQAPCHIEGCLIKGSIQVRTAPKGLLPLPKLTQQKSQPGAQLKRSTLITTSSNPASLYKDSTKPNTITTITHCDLSAASDGVALHVACDSKVRVCHSFIHDSVHSNVVVGDGAHLFMDQCEVSGAHQAGIWFKGHSTGEVNHCEVHRNLLPNICIAANANVQLKYTNIHSSEQNGVAARDSSGGQLSHCQIHDNSYPNLYVTSQSKLHVEHCQIFSGALGGVWIKERAAPVISNCSIYSNAFQNVQLSGNSNATIINNRIFDSSQKGVVVKDEATGYLKDNEIHSHTESNVELQDLCNPHFESNRIYKSQQCGVFIHDTSRGLFVGNDIFENEHSNVFSCGLTAPVLRGNEIHHGMQSGVCCKDRSKALIEKNHIYENKYFNVKLSDYTECIVRHNKMHHSEKAGLCIRGYAKGEISDNEIFESGDENIIIEDVITATPSLLENNLR